MRKACTMSAMAVLAAVSLERAADAQTFATPAANATAGASGVTGFAGTQTGAVSPSSFGTVAGVSTNQGVAAGGTFDQRGAGFGVNAFNPATVGAASVTPFAPINNGIVTNAPVAVTPNGTTIAPVIPNAVTPFYTPYYIYVPYSTGGGPSGGSNIMAQPGGSASESVVAPEAAPQPEYRAVPGGRANFDLDDPYFRAAVTR